MMKPIRIFRHVVCEAPGYLCDFLQHHQIPFELVCLDEGIAVPGRIDDVSALVFMGGPGSVNDPKEWIHQELALIRNAACVQLPVFGVCFGAQLISKALGGRVYPADTLEVGWHAVEKQNNKMIHAAFADLPERFEAFHWHAQTFTVPAGATPLWQSRCVKQQGFIKDKMLATQFHLEVSSAAIREMSHNYASDLREPSTCVQDLLTLSGDMDLRVARLHRLADDFYLRWLKFANLI